MLPRREPPGKSGLYLKREVLTKNRPASGRELVRQLFPCISGWQRLLAMTELAGRQPRQRLRIRLVECVYERVCETEKGPYFKQHSSWFFQGYICAFKCLFFFYIIVTVQDHGKKKSGNNPRTPFSKEPGQPLSVL